MIKLNLPVKLLNPSVPKTCCPLFLWFPDFKRISFQISSPSVCSAHDLCFCDLHKLLNLIYFRPVGTSSISFIEGAVLCPWYQLELKLEEGVKEEGNIVREVNVLVLPQLCIFLVALSSLTLISALSGCNYSFFPAYSCITTDIPVFKCSFNRNYTLNT